MTEPVARAASSRRTVRVAVALAAGQAVLCAVIGWVTFGPSEAKPDAAGVQSLAGPTPFPTLLPLPLKAPPPPAASTSKASSSPRAARSSRPATTRATSKPAADKPRPVVSPERTRSKQPPPKPEVVATQPPPSEDVQSGVVEGKPCEPDGATGMTSDLDEAKCAKDADGDLVWQIN